MRFKYSGVYDRGKVKVHFMRVVNPEYLLFITLLFRAFILASNSDPDETIIEFEKVPDNSGSIRRAAARRAIMVLDSYASTAAVEETKESFQESAAPKKRGPKPKIKASTNDKNATSNSGIPRKRVRKSEEAPGSAKSIASLKSNYSPKSCSAQDISESRNDLMNLLVQSKTSVGFNNRIRDLRIQDIPDELAHDLLIAGIKNGKESNTRNMILKGFRLNLNEVTIQESLIAINDAIDAGKLEFLPLLLDTDPVGTIELSDMIIKAKSDSHIFSNTFKTLLAKNGDNIDSEAILLAAETAANLGSLILFDILYKSELLPKMVPTSSLVKLLSVSPDSHDAILFNSILGYIITDRKLADPFELNLLSQAALDNNVDFLTSTAHYRMYFNWSIAIQALEIALTRKFYTFSRMLLESSDYSHPNSVFSLVPLDKFLMTVAVHANFEIIDKIVNAVYQNGTTMLISDLGLTKIYVKAVQSGNIDVVNYFLEMRSYNGIDMSSSYFDLNMRFNMKSTMRMALENGRIPLVNYLIKTFDYSVYDSDTPSINPSELGGDSLIYIANDKYASTFEYLLKLGANPNARVIYEGKLINLLNWCIINGHKKLVKLLLEYNCSFIGPAMSTLNQESKNCPDIKSYFSDAVARKSEKN